MINEYSYVILFHTSLKNEDNIFCQVAFFLNRNFLSTIITRNEQFAQRRNSATTQQPVKLPDGISKRLSREQAETRDILVL